MMLTIDQIIEAVSPLYISTSCQTQSIQSVEFDTRKVVKDSLFIPLKGERDGHEFIPQAFENGAVLTLSERKLSENIPYLQVADSLAALQQLAKWYLKKINPKVIAVTGSNGKTTTKDMTAAILNTSYATYKTQGNYNNHIGLPYTVLHMPADTEMLVLEMGMDHKGEIDVLSMIGQPDIAAITLIGESHIEYLGSRRGIAESKMEIINGMSDKGTLIIPNDEPLLKELIMDLKQTVETFGMDTEATISGTIVASKKNQTSFTTSLFPGPVFTIPVLGTYNVKNALIAILIGYHCDISVEKIQEGLTHFDLTKNRTEWLHSSNGVEILSDVYNANPTATRLVLDTFSQLAANGRRIIVLGDMLELGSDSKKMHAALAEHIPHEKIQRVFLYGKDMEALYQELLPVFNESVTWYASEQKTDLIEAVQEYVLPKDMVFIKGSNGMKLIDVVNKLREV
ncbi:UDP-N-acetylmuramoyl-tripeptide--D-alanyl-D-alanine ligase [Vagococcus vulneris]|uniref:UDP-N-acetylmuramoyl-tripeptide--D-alanyl-D-alanine ligase n=1 Tax=Vagococcus vulneris TaxID=1977869 RepID=A0A429ZXG6_9ENTE|nr:UDP-N-acetylmuramoyl-tripeptide--D-alanyl-D-alanine ligase [Vagococcus vulneris]RST98579.1 UDP-N-acetylmuramoyl-tripeptide--D-alanyl-D-alanine ligase [Vagococcus vulneris]